MMRLRGLGATAIEYGLISTPPPPPVQRLPTVGVAPGTYTFQVRGLGDVTDSPPTIAGMRLDILAVLLAVVTTTVIVLAKTAK